MNGSDSLKTDLYELTMAAGYFRNCPQLQATFELYCHTMPPNRSFLIACGLAQAVDYILHLRFTDEDIRHLKSLPVFQSVDPAFFRYLKNFRFSGNVWALPEGEICFANEPILQVKAPIIEAQILETYLLSTINVQTSVATKAVRIVQAAVKDGRERTVIDFGSRRAHGPEAGILAARAAYIAGCMGTSNVEAGRLFGIPVFGTMAHSWVEAFDSEEEAFACYQEAFPEGTILLIDTYDSITGLKKAVALKGPLKAVRIDSGDLAKLGRQARKILDGAGLKHVKIIASGNLNEYKIDRLVCAHAPIDIFGVGTDMSVSRDYPALDLTYKLVEVTDTKNRVKYKAKLSPGKHTFPGRKQIFRRFHRNGKLSNDVIGLSGEKIPPSGRPLIAAVIKNGQLVRPLANVQKIREGVRRRLEFLPSSLRGYRVRYSQKLMDLKAQMHGA